MYILVEERMVKVVVFCCNLHSLCITFGDSDEYMYELLQDQGDFNEEEQSPLGWYVQFNNVDGVKLGIQNVVYEPEEAPIKYVRETPANNPKKSLALDTRIDREGRQRRDVVVCSLP